MRVLAAAACATLMSSPLMASDFDTTVMSFKGLLGYYTFTTSSQGDSVVHGYTGVLENGASVGGPGSGPPVNDPATSALVLANGSGGNQDMVSAGKKPLLGKIVGKGSIVAWFKLADLPSNQGRIFSIAGESQEGNDFDLQINSNNQLCFYTDSGGATCDATVFTSGDVGNWFLVTATFKANGARVLYLNGTEVGSSTAGGHSANQAPFYVGESTVFTGRYFDGSIADVAVYSRNLTNAQQKQLWQSRTGAAASHATIGSDLLTSLRH